MGLVVSEDEVVIANELDDFVTYKAANQLTEKDWRLIGR